MLFSSKLFYNIISLIALFLFTQAYAQKTGGAFGGNFMLGPFNSQPVEPLSKTKTFTPTNQVYSSLPFGSFSGIQFYYKSRSDFFTGLQFNTAYWPGIKVGFGNINVHEYSYAASAGYIFYNRHLITIGADGIFGRGGLITDINNTQNVPVMLENGKIIPPGLNEAYNTHCTNFGTSVQIHKNFCNVPKKIKSKPISTFLDMGLKFGWLRTLPDNYSYYQNTNLFFITFALGGGMLEITN